MILVFVALAQWNKVIFMIIPNSYKCDSLLFDSLFFIGASLCILIVKMVRRKRGFQDQENQANYDPQEKRGSRRLRLIVLPLTLLTLKITMHILILFSSRPTGLYKIQSYPSGAGILL